MFQGRSVANIDPVLRSVWSGLGIDSVFAAPHPPGPHQLICKLANIQFTSLSTDCWLMAHIGSLMPDMKIDFNSNYNIKYYQTFQLTKGWLADGGEGLKIINEIWF